MSLVQQRRRKRDQASPWFKFRIRKAARFHGRPLTSNGPRASAFRVVIRLSRTYRGTLRFVFYGTNSHVLRVGFRAFVQRTNVSRHSASLLNVLGHVVHRVVSRLRRTSAVNSRATHTTAFFRRRLRAFKRARFSENRCHVRRPICVSQFVASPSDINFSLKRIRCVICRLRRRRVVNLSSLVVFPALLVQVNGDRRFKGANSHVRQNTSLVTRVHRVLKLRLVNGLHLILNFFRIRLLPFTFLCISHASRSRGRPSPFVPFMSNYQQFAPIMVVRSQMFRARLSFRFQCLSQAWFPGDLVISLPIIEVGPHNGAEP